MNTRSMLASHSPRLPKQQGAALVVGLILLLVITVLAISGMSTASLELQMAGNAQYGQNAFQASETGIEQAMTVGTYDTSTDTPFDSDDYDFETVMHFNSDNGVTEVPEGGYSMGIGKGFKAYHFDITSTGTASRGAQAVHVQSFYIKGQASE